MRSKRHTHSVHVSWSLGSNVLALSEILGSSIPQALLRQYSADWQTPSSEWCVTPTKSWYRLFERNTTANSVLFISICAQPQQPERYADTTFLAPNDRLGS